MLIDAQIRLIERDAGRVRRGQQLVQGGGNMRLRVAARLQVCAKKVGLDATVLLSLRPFAEVKAAEAVGTGRIGEQGNDTILRFTLRAGALRHGPPPEQRVAYCR